MGRRASMLQAVLVLSMLLNSAGIAGALERTEGRIALPGYPVTIEYDEGDERLAAEVEEICRKAIPRMAEVLGLEDVGPMRIVLVKDMSRYRRGSGVDLPHWGAAFAFMREQLMLIDARKAAYTWDALGKTIPHELSHLMVAQAAGSVPLPAWFLEGLAQWQAGEWSIAQSWHLMNAVWTGRFPTLLQISSRFPAGEESARTAYRVAYFGFMEIFEGRDVEVELPGFMRLISEEGGFGEALESFRGENLAEFSARVARKLSSRYTSPLLIFQTGPLFSILAVLFIVVVAAVKLRSRRRLRGMERLEKGL